MRITFSENKNVRTLLLFGLNELISTGVYQNWIGESPRERISVLFKLDDNVTNSF